MALENIIRNFVVYVDGRGYLGEAEEFNPPKLGLVMEEFRGGGMDGAVEVDLGVEKIECDFSLTKYDPEIFALFGRGAGQETHVTLRGAAQGEDGVTTAIIIHLRGKFRVVETGSMKPGEKTTVKVEVTAKYYKHTIGSRVVNELDPVRGVRVIDGVDQLAEQRVALGI